MSRIFASTDKVVVASSPSINNLSAFTYAFWVLPTNLDLNGSNDGYYFIFAKGASGSGLAYENSDDAGVFLGPEGTVHCASGFADSVGANNSLVINVWQRIVMVFDSDDHLIHLYLNGVEASYQVQTAGVGLVDANGDFVIGNGFVGDIAEAKLWNVDLTAQQVLDDFNSVNVLPGNLAVYLHLCGTASPEPDASGNGNVGVVTGTTQGPDSPGFSCVTPPPPVVADILLPLPFSKRTTAAVALFACLKIASPQGAQKFTSDAVTIGALQLEYAQMLSLYRRFRHQPTANNRADLFADIDAGVILLGRLNTTISGMMASGDNGIVLSGMKVVTANAVTTFLKVQEDEYGTIF